MITLRDLTVKQAEAVIITAGAGMGVDSGLPFFHGSNGLWKEYPRQISKRLGYEQMASPHWFATNPELAWAFYGHLLQEYLKVAPHSGFGMLLDICKAKGDNYFVVTSNIDNHFQKAGFDPRKIHEVHGSLAHFQCINGCKRNIWPANYPDSNVDHEDFIETHNPKCPYCGRVARPNVLMFDDFGWIDRREAQQRKRFEMWLQRVCDRELSVLIIEVGAGETVPVIRRMSELFYNNLKWRSSLIRINPRDCWIPKGVHECIKSGGLDGISKMHNRFMNYASLR